MNALRNTILGAATALFFTPLTLAQVNVHEQQGTAPGDSFGFALVATGDLDGDGVGDLWIGAPRTDFAAANSGSAYAVSGASGAELFRVDGTQQGEMFGRSLGFIDDLNNDGVNDLLVGAPFHPGQAFFAGGVYVLSGVDGSQLHFMAGSESFGLLGMSIAEAGDVDGDGTSDFIAGAPEEDSNGTDAGSVYVFSGASGAQIAHRFGNGASDELGTSVCGVRDLDGDGRADYAAGAPLDDNAGTDSGSLKVWSSATGFELLSAPGNSAGDRFGQTLANLGDLNGDGKDELAVGAPFDDFAGVDAGSVAVIDLTNGAALFTINGASGETLGSSLAAAGDTNGDGTLDLIIGGRAGNVARVYSGVDGALLSSLPAPAGALAWGSAVGGGFDIDGDGHAEVSAADELSSAGGLVRSFADHSLLGTPYCSGDGSAAACPCGNTGSNGAGCANSSGGGASLAASGSASISADDLVLQAQGLVSGQPALLFAGLNQVQSGNGALFGDGLRCAGGAVKRLGVQAPDGAGNAAWGPGLASAAAWLAGDLRRLQVWYRDPLASPCGGSFNLSNGFEISFVQ